MTRQKQPSDRYLSRLSTDLANGFREVIITRFEQMMADGYNPHAARYGALTALLMNMGDLIAASADDDDRAEMRAFVREAGMNLLELHSEKLAESAEAMAADPRFNN